MGLLFEERHYPKCVNFVRTWLEQMMKNVDLSECDLTFMVSTDKCFPRFYPCDYLKRGPLFKSQKSLNWHVHQNNTDLVICNSANIQNLKHFLAQSIHIYRTFYWAILLRLPLWNPSHSTKARRVCLKTFYCIIKAISQ